MPDDARGPRPFLLERYFARFEFTTRHLLASSDCEALSLAELLLLADDRDRTAWKGLRLGYTESPGLLELREQIAALYRGLGPDQVVTAAPEEALYLIGRAIFRPGDRVITTYPGYQSLYEIAAAVGARVERWTPEETDRGFWFDPARLVQLARGGARAIVVNFPHNPTGALPTPVEWAAVVDVAERAGATLVADEMYRGLEYAVNPLTPGAVASERGVSVGGLSKAYGLPGLRTGWLATRDRALLEAVQAYKDYTTICASAPGERLAVIALKNAARLVDRCRGIVAANRPLLQAFVARHPERFAWRGPQAGPITFARFLPGEAAQAFCETLATKGGVMLLPSTVFEWGDSHVRFGFGRTSFPDALDALEKYLQ